MRERTDQLCATALESSDEPILARLKMIQTLFYAIEARLQDGFTPGSKKRSRLTMEHIEDIAGVVARKLDRTMFVFDAAAPRPKHRPS